MAALAGSSLLAALHSSLERIKTIKRVCRALSKKPQLRTSIEVGYIMAETEKQPLLTREGPGVHRDLCHVARVVSLKEMDSWKLPPQWGQAGAPTCVFVLVLQGRVQLKTKCREAFAARLRAAGGDRSGSAPSNGAEGEGSGFEGASEEELLSLFNSIDTDGSGAIDVSELQTALEMMGIHKSEDEVAELMDGVDDDGSGELEFPEFKAILRKAINGGGAGQDLVWREQPQQPGVWVGDLTAGSAVGEAAILDTSPQLQDGGLMALETTDLLVLERADYERILENGFDGELKAKMTLLRSAPVLGEALRRTDLRRLAYASERRSLGRNVALYEQGAAPAGLELIVEGQCKLVVKVAVTESSSMVGSRRGTDTGIAALGPSGAAAPSSAAGASSAGGAAQAASSAGGTAGQGGSGAAAPSLQQMQQQLLGRVAAADDDVCSSRDSSPSAAAMLRRGSSHLVKAGRSKRLELAVLGPGDMCSEASVLGEERHAHSCVVTSQSLVVLSVSTKDLRKCVHPADMATLREHFERRYSQRSSRLAVAASVAAMSASELARVRRGTGGGGNGGEESAAASLSGAAHVDSFGSRRSTLSGMAEATGSGANGVGGGEAARPGTPAAALDRLAAVMRGRSRPSTQGSSSSFTAGVSSSGAAATAGPGAAASGTMAGGRSRLLESMQLSGSSSSLRHDSMSQGRFGGSSLGPGGGGSNALDGCGPNSVVGRLTASGVSGGVPSPALLRAAPTDGSGAPLTPRLFVSVSTTGASPHLSPGRPATVQGLYGTVGSGATMYGNSLLPGLGGGGGGGGLFTPVSAPTSETSTAMNSGTGMGAGWGPGDAAMVQAVLAGDADAVGLGGGGGGGMLAAGSSHGQSSSGGVTVTRGGQNELLSYMLGQSVPLDAGEQAYRRINTAPLPAAGHTSSTSVPSNALCTPPGTGTGLSSNATSLTPTPSPLPSAPVSLDGPSLPPPAASQLPPKPPQPHSSSAGGSATPGGVGSATPRAAGSPSPLIRTTSGAAAAAAAAAAALAGPSLGAILSALEAPTVPSRTGGRVRDARTRSEESAGAVTGTGPWPVAGHQRPDYLSASQPIVPGLDQVSQRSPVQLSPRSPLFSSYATAAVNLAAAAAAQSPRGMPTAARPPPPPAVATPAVSKLGYTSQSYHPAWAGGGFGTGGDGGSSASALPSPVSVGVVGAGGAGLAQHCSAAAMDGCGAAVGADLAAQASAASSLPSHAPSAVDVGLPVAVAVNPQGTPAGAAAEEALQYATAAAGVSSWFPTPRREASDASASGGAATGAGGAGGGGGGVRQKWTVSRYPRAMADGLLALDATEAEYNAAVAAAGAAVAAATAAFGGNSPDPATASAAKGAVLPQQAQVQPQLLPPPQPTPPAAQPMRKLFSRGLDLTATPPMSPAPPLTDDEDEAAPQGGGAAGRGLMVIGNPRRGSGGDTELSDGEDGADDEDEWDAPLLALPAGGVAAMVKMVGGGGASAAAAAAARGGCGGGVPSAASACGYASGDSGPLLGAVPPAAPLSAGVPRLALHRLRASDADGDQTGCGGGGSAPLLKLQMSGSFTAGGSGASVLPYKSPSSRTVVGSVKAMIRGWQTARAAGTITSTAQAASAHDGGMASQPSGGSLTARMPTSRNADALRSSVSALTATDAAAAAAGAAGGATWGRETVAAALAVSGGDRGRLAAVYSTMLKHGEHVVKPSLEQQLVMQRVTASRGGGGGVAAGAPGAPLTPTPPPRAAWSSPRPAGPSAVAPAASAFDGNGGGEPSLLSSPFLVGGAPPSPRAGGGAGGLFERAAPQALPRPGGASAAATHMMSDPQLALLHSVVKEAVAAEREGHGALAAGGYSWQQAAAGGGGSRTPRGQRASVSPGRDRRLGSGAVGGSSAALYGSGGSAARGVGAMNRR
ncbi:hypothetical protein CHLRE_12g509500v5 [Chlamydomonas reinhardtii]|uniref:Calmodulin n=1 Tax=Chlamydomonas reinhardtii TaxID=3055 RepID=A0A2K3D2P2_CHLRE|nr:uncharacterized protein CHLRE_12g509500v5 [Chlamydomonas reinhardtii]PNW74795.1 hypothetical protein CHLRE_12g509500v5 [Chlamydomonas reinhardtii]